MYRYRAYGLGIQSRLPLPELLPGDQAAADITIRYGLVDTEAVGLLRMGNEAQVGAQVATFFWEGVGAYQVYNGCEVVVEPLPGIEERLVRLPLLGTVLAVLLQQRQLWVLHASAVAIAGRAVVIMGPKGQGKSTTTTALYQRGHWLVADDVVALVPGTNETFDALPGFPQCKLWPDAAAAMGLDLAQLPLLATGFEKRASPIHERFVTASVPVAAVCVLGVGPVSALHPLAPQAALAALITHTYVARFGDALLRETFAVAHLQACAALVRTTPVYRFERPRNLALLNQSVELLESFVGAQAELESV